MYYKWMNLENIRLTERSQTHKRPHILGFHLYEIYGIGKSMEKEKRLVVARGWKGWNGE